MSTIRTTKHPGLALPMALAGLGALLLLLKGALLVALGGCGGEDDPGGWWPLLWGGSALAAGAAALYSLSALAGRSPRKGAAWLAVAILVSVAPEAAIAGIGLTLGQSGGLAYQRWLLFVLAANVGIVPLALAAGIALWQSRHSGHTGRTTQSRGDA